MFLPERDRKSQLECELQLREDLEQTEKNLAERQDLVEKTRDPALFCIAARAPGQDVDYDNEEASAEHCNDQQHPERPPEPFFLAEEARTVETLPGVAVGAVLAQRPRIGRGALPVVIQVRLSLFLTGTAGITERTCVDRTVPSHIFKRVSISMVLGLPHAQCIPVFDERDASVAVEARLVTRQAQVRGLADAELIILRGAKIFRVVCRCTIIAEDISPRGVVFS